MTAEERKKIQQSYLESLKLEIEDLKGKIKKSKGNNKVIKNLKIFRCMLKTVSPYLLTVGITSGVLFSLKNPFDLNEWKCYAHFALEYDQFSKLTRQEVYYDSSLQQDRNHFIKQYTKWEQQDDESYSRMVTTYEISYKKTLQELLELLSKDLVDIRDFSIKETSKVQEIKYALTEEELNKEAFLQATYYCVDTNDFILVEETIGEHVMMVFIEVILILISQLLPLAYRLQFPYDSKTAIKKIKKEYDSSCMNIKVLRKKLEIREENYQRLLEE